MATKTTFTDVRDLMYILMYLTKDNITGERIDGVSENIYMDALPTTMPNDIKQCVLLDFESNIVNMNAFEYGTIRVHLLVQDEDSGALLGDMERNFIDTIRKYEQSADAGVIGLRMRYKYAAHDPNRKLRGFVQELLLTIKE